MMRHIIILAIFIVSAVNASADFNSGIDAYNKKNYRTAFVEFQQLADQGNVDAQYMLGYMYASGKGVIQDYIQAHLWFNIAAANGNDRAINARDKLAEVMTPQQVAEAQRLAYDWKPKPILKTESDKTAKPSSTIGLKGSALIREIQSHLKALGYDPGPADGKMGSRTRWAISDFQKQEGLSIDGEPSQSLLEKLQKKREKQFAEANIQQKPGFVPTSVQPIGGKVPSDDQTQEVIDQLKKIVKKGEDERLADSHFLAKLRELIRRYDWPWRSRIIHDDFQDSDLTANPSWNLVSGNFWVDTNKRLTTRVRSLEQKREPSSDNKEEDSGTRILKTILGEILKEKGEDSSRPMQPVRAEIYSSASITNSFSMDIEFVVLGNGNDAKLEIGPFKGRQRDEGYRLIYVGGQTCKIELARQSYGGFSTIDISKSLLTLNDGQVHLIRWQRYSDGSMIIAIDGKVIIHTIDRTFQNAFDGISIVNYSGDFAFVSIDVLGTKK